MAAQLEREERHRSQESFLGHPSGLQVMLERKLDEEIGKPATRWGLAQLCAFLPCLFCSCSVHGKQLKGKSGIHGVCLRV